MNEEPLIDGMAFDATAPGVVYEFMTWTVPSSARSARTRCQLREDGTLKVQLENNNGVPMGAVVFDREGWENLIREADRVWKK